MKNFNTYLVLTVLTILMAVSPALKEACSAEAMFGADEAEGPRVQIHNIEASIARDRDKIIAETKAIGDDRRKIKDAGRLADKTKAAQIKEEAEQDIKNRQAVIKTIKASISTKKDQRGDLLYGAPQKIEQREAGR